MRIVVGTNLLLTFALLGGCTSAVQELAASNRKFEDDQAASCRRYDERANLAAHPDAGAIALHDRLVARAEQLKSEAAGLQGAALEHFHDER